jgi:hypothetical protein
VHLSNEPRSFEEMCARFEQAEQGLQLLLFAIINTFIFEAMKTDRLRFLSQTFPTNFKAMCR